MFLLWLKLSAAHILLPQQTYLNVIERKYKRQILLPDPIILADNTSAAGPSFTAYHFPAQIVNYDARRLYPDSCTNYSMNVRQMKCSDTKM